MTSSVVQVQWCDTKLRISANNEAMLLKLGKDVAPQEIYQMVHILMLLWQYARFQSLPLQNQILPFVPALASSRRSVSRSQRDKRRAKKIKKPRREGGLLFIYEEKRERRERKIINRINAIFGIILLFKDNDGHVTNHVKKFSTPRHFISCCYLKEQEI